jgi:hypothetical protein
VSLPTIDVVEGVTFVCPFCKGIVRAGELTTGQCGVLHAVPPCVEFLAMAPDVFLRECNRHLAAEQPS